MWNLKYDTNEHIYKTDVQNRLVVAKGKGAGGGLHWEFGINRCKLLYTGWINNKILLCSTGNYTQYPVINHNGKEYIYVYTYMYICIMESICCTAEINTTL